MESSTPPEIPDDDVEAWILSLGYESPVRRTKSLPPQLEAFIGPRSLLDQTRSELQERASKIIETFHKLSNVFGCYKDDIQSEWTHMSNERRGEILLAAWPDMPRTQYTNLWAVYRLNRG
ncbi:hypothetical protein F4678DRAFT_455557 [Xylaria arbuscula]|nr:hypothetical protein F4678DRAFT_455557 [Xylaria arbuscula]